MNNMYCNYKHKKYTAKVHDEKILIVSKIEQDGFDKYIDILGKEHDDLFMKEVDFDEVEVVYKEIVEIEFEGIYFQLFSSRITQSNIENGIFTLFTSSEELAREYGFERKEQFVFIRDISKEQVEAIKIVQKPIKGFETRGTQEILVERSHIDEWLSTLE